MRDNRDVCKMYEQNRRAEIRIQWSEISKFRIRNSRSSLLDLLSSRFARVASGGFLTSQSTDFLAPATATSDGRECHVEWHAEPDGVVSEVRGYQGGLSRTFSGTDVNRKSSARKDLVFTAQTISAIANAATPTLSTGEIA
jgi:hypothetical protein